MTLRISAPVSGPTTIVESHIRPAVAECSATRTSWSDRTTIRIRVSPVPASRFTWSRNSVCIVRSVADGVQLLELVDHEQPAAGPGGPLDRSGQLGPGIVAGRDDSALPTTAVGERTVGQRSEHTRAHQRRLAAARGSNDREQVAGRQPHEQLRDQSLAPEEHGRVVLLVAGQAAIRVHVLLAWSEGTIVTVTLFQELAQTQHRVGAAAREDAAVRSADVILATSTPTWAMTLRSATSAAVRCTCNGKPPLAASTRDTASVVQASGRYS